MVVIGYFGYKEVSHYLAQKVVDKMSRSITPEEVAKLTNDPEIIKEAQSHSLQLDPSNLTLHDKEAVISIVTNDFSASEIKDIAVKVGRGNLTEADKQQLIAQYKSKLSQQDIDQLKSIAAEMIQK